MSELRPTKENLSDPYVLQLIEALSMQQDQIEDLEEVVEAKDKRIEELTSNYREAQEELTAFCLLNDEKDRRIEELEAANVQLRSEVKLLKDGFESEEDQEYVHNEVTGLHNMADLYRIEKLEAAIDYMFENAATSWMGINFSFKAVKRLREARGER